MSERGDKEFLSDILESIRRIELYIERMDYGEFLKDIRTQDAVVRNLEIIGEATKRLSEDLRERNPGIPWKNMAKVRDRLIHAYFGINYDVVWQIATNEIPEIKPGIEKISKKKARKQDE